MRIHRSRLLDPAANGFYAVTAIAVSVFIFAYSTRFGPASILLYYALWLPLFALSPRTLLARPLELVLPAALIALMILSFFWSNASGNSLRGGIQYLTHFLCALAAARVVSLRSLARGFLIGIFVVVLYSLAFGEYGYDSMDGTYTFVGAFGSKNQLGLNCSLGIFFACAYLLTMRDRKWVHALVALAALLFVYTLVSARSATSVFTLIVSLAVLVGIVGLLRLKPHHRLGFAACMAPLVVAVAIAFIQFSGADAVLGAFGKDSTLTGRTYLWQEGINVGLDHPVLGIGYQAFWVQGFPDAERLWAEFYIGSRMGFHFHNTFIETFAELGSLGLTVMVLMLVILLFRLVLAVLRSYDRIAACYMALLTMLLIRAFTEIDFLYPFSVGGFLLIFIYCASRESVAAPRTFAPMLRRA